MSLREKIYNKLGFVSKEAYLRAIKVVAQRGFDAAKHDRLRYGWKTTRNEINQELKGGDWAALNARVFEMRLNNPIIAGSVIDNRVNMVGPSGFDYQPMVLLPNGEPDEKARNFLVEKFDEWCEEEYCTITRRTPFRMLQWQIADSFEIDGAYIARMHYVGETVANNPFGFSLELLDIADIDHTYNAELSDGTTVVMGIRVDKWRRIISVFFKDRTIYQEITGGYNNGYRRKEIFYDELLYGFDPLHPKMVNAVTPWAAALIKMKDLDIYTNYHMQNAKWAAGKMGFIKTAKDAHEYDGPPQSSNTTETVDNDGVVTIVEEVDDGGKYMDIEGGVIEKLPYGNDIELFDPRFPSEQLPDFTRVTGREIASSRGKDYAAMWGDREGESYSSGRSGEMKTNNTTAYQQALFTDLFLTRLTKNWLRFSLANGALAPYEYVDYKRLKPHYWQSFFRGWIDPLKQAMTDRVKMEDGSQSLNQTITRNGGRMKDVFEDEATRRKYVEQYGFDIVKNKTPETKIDETNNDDDKNEKKDTKKDDENRSSGLTILYKA